MTEIHTSKLSRRPGYHRELQWIVAVSIASHQPFMTAVGLAERLIAFPEDMTSKQRREVARQYTRFILEKMGASNPHAAIVMFTNLINKPSFSLSFSQVIEEYPIHIDYHPSSATVPAAAAS